MSVPQYKINVHVASILSSLGLPIRAEEPFFVAKRRKIPDFILSHSVAGTMLGEAEIGTSEFDNNAIKKLEKRVHERFYDNTFKGYDFIMLLVYPSNIVDEISSLPESKIDNVLMEKTIGLGIAARGEVFQLKDNYVRWYREPVRVVDIPQILDTLINEFFSSLSSYNPHIRANIYDVVENIISIIENCSRSISLKIRDQSFINQLSNVARRLNIAWDVIKKLEDKIKITTKFIMLMSALIMIFYEIVRNERLYELEPLECDNLNFSKLSDLFEELITDRKTGKLRYSELNTQFIEVLKEIPEHMDLNTALRELCREIKNNYVLIRRMGWDILSMIYQKLLSETYRHAFATFYTKLPAARLLASLAIEKLDDEVIDPASGTGSLLLASLERRRTLIERNTLRNLYKKSLDTDRPLLDIVNEIILSKTAGLDALKPACFIAALNLRIATQGSLPSKLDIYNIPVGEDRAGSLDLLNVNKRNVLPEDVKTLYDKKYDVVIMNPPFTRSDRISFLIGETARNSLLSKQLYFGNIRVNQIFVAGMAKPFMVLADKLVKEGGRIAAVLPNSILSRSSWKEIRKELLNSYNIEYIVVSWASGTPNFSSDTRFREILMVARKRIALKPAGSLRIINLYKKVDDLTADEIERISRKASTAREGVTNITSNNDVIASIISINLENEIRKRLKTMGFVGTELEKRVKEEYEKFGNNLYRLIAFRTGELLKLHLDIVVRCSIRFGDIFDIGSVIDHTSGLSESINRDASISLLHEAPALWGSGESLGVNRPWLDRAPYKIGVINEDSVKVTYWKDSPRTFYLARVFIPRRIRLSTQYVLMTLVNEPCVSNVWWPIKPKENESNITILPYLVYMNSIFGFINLLGERLETEGLYMELKKNHLREMPIPDLRKKFCEEDIINILRSPMPRFDEYIAYMAKIEENSGKPWFIVAEDVAKNSRNNKNLQLYANRAILDLKAYELLCDSCKDIQVPNNFYELVHKDVEVLRQIMDRDDQNNDVIIEDIAERVKKKVKHVPLDRWLSY